MLILKGIVVEAFRLFLEMSPYLLLGYFFAGLIHIIFPKEKVVQHLGGNGMIPVLKAAIVGVPLPLCSCGVIPVVVSLRKQGASKGACLSFLTATPTSGIDSILATYSLLGLVFAVYRVIASFITGLFSGFIANIFDKEPQTALLPPENNSCQVCDIDIPHTHTLKEKLKAIFSYGFIGLLEDTGRWILLGVLIGGAIVYFIPTGFIERYLGLGILPMLIMLVIGIPIYVCAAGSIPIAAALMLKGLSPGGAFVFLLAGPATNAVTITVIAKYFGKKTVVLYVLSIAIASILLGFLLNFIWGDIEIAKVVMHGKMLPMSVKIILSIFLSGLILYSFRKMIKIKKHKEKALKEFFIKVPNMTCQHCVKTIGGALKKLNEVTDFDINLKTKIVTVNGSEDLFRDSIIDAIEKAGYECS